MMHQRGKSMLTIHVNDPSIEEYVAKIGKDNLEKMFLTFLKVKTMVRPKHSRTETKKAEGAQAMNWAIDMISQRLGEKYADKSYDDLRNEFSGIGTKS